MQTPNHTALLHEFNKQVRLTADDEALIIQAFRNKKVRKNQILVQPPDIAFHEHFVVNGLLVQYYIDEDGNQHALSFASEGWWTTDLQSFLQKQESKYFVEAIEDSELLVISKDAFDKLLDDI